jgi:hypothetical protein
MRAIEGADGFSVPGDGPVCMVSPQNNIEYATWVYLRLAQALTQHWLGIPKERKLQLMV